MTRFVQTVSVAEVDVGGIIVWSLALVILLVLLFMLLSWLRKRLAPRQEPLGAGFTLADLRALRKDGKISDEEYEKAKARILASAQAAANRSGGREQQKIDL